MLNSCVRIDQWEILQSIRIARNSVILLTLFRLSIHLHQRERILNGHNSVELLLASGN